MLCKIQPIDQSIRVPAELYRLYVRVLVVHIVPIRGKHTTAAAANSKETRPVTHRTATPAARSRKRDAESGTRTQQQSGSRTYLAACGAMNGDHPRGEATAVQTPLSQRTTAVVITAARATAYDANHSLVPPKIAPLGWEARRVEVHECHGSGMWEQKWDRRRVAQQLIWTWSLVVMSQFSTKSSI